MNWKKVSSKPAYTGRRAVDMVTFNLPTGITADYEIKREGTPVCVLALTPDNHVILVKQFRPGPEKVLLELPGGFPNKGEDPVDAIGRELMEETGYSGELTFVGTSLADAYSTCVRHNYLARKCIKTGEPENNPNEPTEVVIMPLPDFRVHLRSGELTDVATAYLALDHADLL